MYSPVNFDPKNWQDFEPHYRALLHETLTPANLSEWLHRGSELEKYVWEMRAGFKHARSRNIEDESPRQAYQHFTDEIFVPFQEISHALQAKVLLAIQYRRLHLSYHLLYLLIQHHSDAPQRLLKVSKHSNR